MTSRSGKNSFKGIDLKNFRKKKSTKIPKGKAQVQIKSGRSPIVLHDDNGPILFDIYETKVEDIKRKYLDLENPIQVKGTSYYQLDLKKTVSFFCKGGPMQNDEKISEYVGKLGILIITVQFHVNAGSKVKDDEKDDEKYYVPSTNKNKKSIPFFSYDNPRRNKKRVLDITLGIDWPLSDKPDMVTLEIDKKNNVYMTCDHTISPSSLFDIMLATFINTEYEYKILCPIPKCNQEWEFDLCVLVADLDETETMEFECEIESRKSPSKKCPHCSIYCKRPNDLRYYRVACLCKKGDWCYECGNTWKGGGFTVCGNEICHTNEINDILKNCGKLKCGGSLSSYQVPKLRACPKCYAFANHNSACKHMHCKSCGNFFCFICLKSAEIKDGSKTWKCTKLGAYANCGVEPIQKVK